jgi:prepilin-type N-terminal cleavage/methylation domain-containing protein
LVIGRLAIPRAARRTQAFTLIELLVVIAIIAVLTSILVPALGAARRQARATASYVNLRNLQLGMISYQSDFKDQYINPFQVRRPLPANVAQYTQFTLPRTVHGQPWNFNDAGYQTELFSAHWASVALSWIDEKSNLASPVQFAPSDDVVRLRFDRWRGRYSLEQVIWDGSYIYSPTMWFRATRYAGNGNTLPPPTDPLANAGAPNTLRYNRGSDVLNPTLKAVLFERFDWKRVHRQAPNVRARLAPQWNNPDAEPGVAFADGSVREVRIRDLDAARLDPNPDAARAITPVGNWAVPQSVLTRYDMQLDNFENGTNGTGAWPAYFWATRDGVRGRDVVR